MKVPFYSAFYGFGELFGERELTLYFINIT